MKQPGCNCSLWLVIALACSSTVVSAWTTVPTTTTISSIRTRTNRRFSPYNNPYHNNNRQSSTTTSLIILHSSEKRNKKETPSSSSNDHTSTNKQDETQQERTSFDDAGQGLRDQEDNKRLAEMGDFDSNPDYQSDNIDKMREAIRKRTSEMGLEKNVLSQEILKERALQRRESTNSNQRQQLDISKIRGSIPDDMPSMFYNPEEEMSEEEKREVDPIQTKNWFEQGRNELESSKWPDVAATIREVFLMIAVIALTALLIIQWDATLRGFYTDTLNVIPTKQEIQSRFTNLDLPEGWTQSLNEKDVMNLPDQIRTQVKESGDTSGGSLPDL